MTIIQIEPLQSGQHPIESQDGRRECWKEGYIKVPEDLESNIWATLGWCDLIIEGGKLTGVTQTERPVFPEIEPEPTEIEQLRADIDFIAAMGGIAL